MTSQAILHSSLSRSAAPAEIAEDAAVLARLAASLPPPAVVMAFAPREARARIQDWSFFIEDSFRDCDTLAGFTALQDATNALGALEISHDLAGIREKISAAFEAIHEAARALAQPSEWVPAHLHFAKSHGR